MPREPAHRTSRYAPLPRPTSRRASTTPAAPPEEAMHNALEQRRADNLDLLSQGCA